jgi:squalene-hopene/tetraprenyl-beta-curcumene cyclase
MWPARGFFWITRAFLNSATLGIILAEFVCTVSRSIFMKRFVYIALCGALALSTIRAAEPKTDEAKKVLTQGYDFLKSKQGADGSFIPRFTGPGGAALVAAALIKNGYSVDDPVVAKCLAYLEKSIKDDGGVYDRAFATYTTSLAVMAFKDANKDKKYDKAIADAGKFLRKVQEASGTDETKLGYGGAGYGTDGRSRPDTSNTAFFLEALIATGAGKDDPAVKKAITFLSRAQNLPGEYNDQPFAKKAGKDDEGGFVYNPSEQDNKDSEKKSATGGLRSEGGMTYAGLKSFLYAGLTKEDPRVKAAIRWIRNHYTLTENPGMGSAGLYYYYHTFAKAMDALGEEEFVDAKDVKHPWRKELFETLQKAQKKDGSWVNENRAFLENSPELATAFALLALGYTHGK